MPRKAVFLDRDGVVNLPIVINGRPYPPRHAGEFVWMEGVHDTLRTLRERGYVLLVVTNQPDVARGTLATEQLDEIHRRMLTELPIDRVYVCLHDDADGCECRKPKPGMLLSGSADFGVELKESWVVGDRWRDIEAGRAAGCQTVLVQHGYAERQGAADCEIKRIPELLDIIR